MDKAIHTAIQHFRLNSTCSSLNSKSYKCTYIRKQNSKLTSESHLESCGVKRKKREEYQQNMNTMNPLVHTFCSSILSLTVNEQGTCTAAG